MQSQIHQRRARLAPRELTSTRPNNTLSRVGEPNDGQGQRDHHWKQYSGPLQANARALWQYQRGHQAFKSNAARTFNVSLRPWGRGRGP